MSEGVNGACRATKLSFIASKTRAYSKEFKEELREARHAREVNAGCDQFVEMISLIV